MFKKFFSLIALVIAFTFSNTAEAQGSYPTNDISVGYGWTKKVKDLGNGYVVVSYSNSSYALILVDNVISKDHHLPNATSGNYVVRRGDIKYSSLGNGMQTSMRITYYSNGKKSITSIITFKDGSRLAIEEYGSEAELSKSTASTAFVDAVSANIKYSK